MLLIAQVLYGAGLRLSNGLRLRVKDVDFGHGQIVIRDGKGDMDRVTVLPATVVDRLKSQIEFARCLHERDLAEGHGRVWLPYALSRKYPNAEREFIWQFIFPASRISKDPRSGDFRRHHLHGDSFSDALKVAAGQSGLTKRITSPVFRHSFATHMLAAGYDIRTVQIVRIGRDQQRRCRHDNRGASVALRKMFPQHRTINHIQNVDQQEHSTDLAQRTTHSKHPRLKCPQFGFRKRQTTRICRSR